MWPFDDIGGALGDQLGGMLASAFEAAMKAIWNASLLVLQGAFGLADQFSVFSVDTRTGPISILWPMMLWISGVLAVGLFFWQLTMTSLRGGRGFMRLVGGPVQYGIALAVTVGVVAAFLAGVDGITDGILKYGLQAENFSDALEQTGFGDAVGDGVDAVVLGLCAFFGVIPAAIGYCLEMLFREAAVYVLVATIPLSAAGLLAGITASWFWRTCRWLAAAICMKPVLALALVLGVAISGGAEGLSGLLAGVGVLLVSLFCPFVLFRLFAFVDPNSDAGAAFRDALSGLGVDSYGANNPAMMAGGGSGGGGAMEDANTGRFDEAVAEHADDDMDETGGGESFIKSQWAARDKQNSEDPGSDSEIGGSGGGDADDDGAAPLPANHGSVVSSSPNAGPSGDYGDDPAGGDGDAAPGPSGPGTSSSPPDGGSGGAAAGVEEAAVIV